MTAPTPARPALGPLPCHSCGAIVLVVRLAGNRYAVAQRRGTAWVMPHACPKLPS